MSARDRDWDVEWEESDPTGHDGFHTDHERRSGLAVGFLAMLPLCAAYEYAQHANVGTRNAAEMVLLRVLEPLDPGLAYARPIVLVLCALVALVTCYRRRVALAPSLFRVTVEGVVLAVSLGPLLVVGTRLSGTEASVLRRLTSAGDGVPELAGMAQVFGGSAYEELLFRVLGYALCFLVARTVFRAARAPVGVARWSAEALGAVGSSLLFACFHLASWTGWLGIGGEAFDAAAFTWRFLAGLALAITFRWRGPGVAAWGHGLFNAWLLMGADPATLL
ncbi:MAG: hypothetical protein H6831_13175 [Planctomycetes bacterium]|nr:hypothetical protein [Planctomycetota bacterium]MCB9905351.1 hypothetical protein [Planctomycetota bacterium]